MFTEAPNGSIERCIDSDVYYFLGKRFSFSLWLLLRYITHEHAPCLEDMWQPIDLRSSNRIGDSPYDFIEGAKDVNFYMRSTEKECAKGTREPLGSCALRIISPFAIIASSPVLNLLLLLPIAIG